jgi:O-antigen/teichoic acid export membrane protein
MKQKVLNLIKHPLIFGSGILVFGSLIANFLNFLFNLFMSRSLTPADYGVLATLTAFIGFPTLAANAIGPVVVRYGGEYFANQQLHLVRGLYSKISRIFIAFSLILCLFLFIFTPQISSFLQISNTFVLYLTDIIIFFSVVSIINVSFLQAKLSFGFQVIVSIINSAVKLGLAVGLVYLGYAINGTVTAMAVAFIISYIASFYPLRFVFNKNIKSVGFKTKELFTYGLPSALTLFGLTSFISADIILVKHFFSPALAGYYAGLSLIGKVIFYFSSPIGNVMFPVIVQKHARKENFNTTFWLSMGLVLLPSLLLTAFYFLFPQFTIIFFLKKTEYLAVSSLLGWFGVLISLYAVLTIVCNFYLSIKKTFIYIPVLLAAVAQIVLLILFHQTFVQIVIISIVIIFLLMLGLLLYYPYATKK